MLDRETMDKIFEEYFEDDKNKDMTLNQYQKEAHKTAIYPALENSRLIYPSLKLAGEAGEVAEKIGKLFRDHKGELNEERRNNLIKELGDVLWYIAALATELNMDLSEVARLNIGKLKKRQENGTLQGEGDNR